MERFDYVTQYLRVRIRRAPHSGRQSYPTGLRASLQSEIGAHRTAAGNRIPLDSDQHCRHFCCASEIVTYHGAQCVRKCCSSTSNLEKTTRVHPSQRLIRLYGYYASYTPACTTEAMECQSVVLRLDLFRFVQTLGAHPHRIRYPIAATATSITNISTS